MNTAPSYDASLIPADFGKPDKFTCSSGASLYYVYRPEQQTSTRSLTILLHGYPQRLTLWYEMLTALAADGRAILLVDLPGYGQSTKAVSEDHSAHSKAAMAKDIRELAKHLCPDKKVLLIGHDRGARVSYRWALNYEEEVAGIVLMDIVPVWWMYDNMKLENSRHLETFGSYHWIFLALQNEMPYEMIASNPTYYYRHTIDSWTGTRCRGKLGEQAMQSWIQPYVDNKDNIRGALEDYRAGATVDLAQEIADGLPEGKKLLSLPTLILYSAHLRKRFDVEKIWRGLISEDAHLQQACVGDIETGHFLPVEAAKECLDHIHGWEAGLDL